MSKFRILHCALSACLVILFLTSCQTERPTSKAEDTCKNQGLELPEWAKNAPLYQVNIRQFTKEGTLTAFKTHLPRLAEMNVKILWIMPIQPIGKLYRKGRLGSYYSISDYRKVHEDYGTLDDFREVVNEAHRLGMRVILDWVANHTAWDHPWVSQHPEWYRQNEKGEIISPIPDWSDVAQLDYSNSGLREAMKNEMKFWVFETDIDGFRCDVAEMVPSSFWSAAFSDLLQIKPLYFLAEAEGIEMYENFHATYGWQLHHIVNRIAQRDSTAEAIDNYLDNQQREGYRKNMQRMYFTSNHDENSWNGTEFERLGDFHKAMFVTMAFLPNAIPMIYSGQEAALNRRLNFFDHDPIEWRDYELKDFYKKVFGLFSSHPAVLSACPTGDFLRLDNGEYKNLYIYMRAAQDRKVLVIANLGNEIARVPDLEITYGEWTDLMSDKKITLKAGFNPELLPGEFRVMFN
ncbi:MAG: alpha-amylase family glycosyl hydrolase [Thermaurantimonas sp.]